MKRTEIHPVTKIVDERHELIDDTIIKELPLALFLNKKEVATILCTPDNLDHLAAGYLYSERYIQKREDILNITVDERRGIVWVEANIMPEAIDDLRNVSLLSPGCFGSTPFSRALDAVVCQTVTSETRITSREIARLLNKVQSKAILYRTTGGVHSAAFCTRERLIFFCEDIGRHNAIDKIFGMSLLKGIDTRDKIIITSGRVSSAVLIKIIKAHIPIIVSRSAPTSESIRLSKRYGITLIGFARGKRLNIYSHEERILD